MADPQPKYLDWLASDAGVRLEEIDFHEKLHQERSRDEVYLRRQLNHPRLRLLTRIERVLGKPISGDVIDIGCGSGYLAVHLAKTRATSKVHAMEITKAAAELLIPRMVELAQVPDGRVIPVRGSFASLPVQNAYDYVFSFGAIHHSFNLLRTLEACLSALRPGGYLIAQEPATLDHVTNAAFLAKYGVLEQGSTGPIQNADRDDHFFRDCEYKAAAHHAGFEPVSFDDVAADIYSRPTRRGRIDLLKHRLGLKPLLSIKDGLPRRPVLMIWRKPVIAQSTIPHRWV